jgi:hypothetical protein
VAVVSAKVVAAVAAMMLQSARQKFELPVKGHRLFAVRAERGFGALQKIGAPAQLVTRTNLSTGRVSAGPLNFGWSAASWLNGCGTSLKGGI